MRTPRWLGAGLALLLTSALAGCGGGTGPREAAVPPPVDPAQLAGVTLKVGDQKGGSQTLLKAAGLLDDVPYTIEWATFTSGPPLLEAASAGAVDIGGVGNTPPIFAAAANADIGVVSAARGDVAGDALLVAGDSPLRAVSELRGKRVGVARGSSAHGQLLYTLRAAGLSTQDVELSFLQPADGFSAFTQGNLDAWAVWDPYTAQARIEAGARVLADGTGTANGYTFQVAGRSALADAGKNSAIRDYVTRLSRAQLWSDRNREPWAQSWAAETGLDPEVALAAVRNGPDLPIALDDAVVRSEQDLADTFSKEKVLPGKVDFGQFVDRRYTADLDTARGRQ
ncbi:ABC transporter substrate-binding protein [Amycolatopsis antarctica]|uniref:Putative aliphatic sulfonates-binding protein n=1 Tax=Amycolatopsis antarctica TaxID=1854586 RepID=A0A263D1R2_9PSEU|nr:ABC transporter substrate-binding protein [Amycolatopsis antarctica]OZM72380.1 ABC transporter substrate-binding protein [Amycolatopsis antarctica]